MNKERKKQTNKTKTPKKEQKLVCSADWNTGQEFLLIRIPDSVYYSQASLKLTVCYFNVQHIFDFVLFFHKQIKV